MAKKALTSLICVVCGASLVSKRAITFTCSDKCRQRKCRARSAKAREIARTEKLKELWNRIAIKT